MDPYWLRLGGLKGPSQLTYSHKLDRVGVVGNHFHGNSRARVDGRKKIHRSNLLASVDTGNIIVI